MGQSRRRQLVRFQIEAAIPKRKSDAVCQFRTHAAQQTVAANHQEHALNVANRAIAISNLREGAHRLLMRALAAGGRRADALKHSKNLLVPTMLARQRMVGVQI